MLRFAWLMWQNWSKGQLRPDLWSDREIISFQGVHMPLFEFHCESCDRQVELLVSRTERPSCPECGSKKMEKLMSVSAGRV